jgi:hypothetical protein
MCEHEKKYCPHCNILFECKVGSILLCQCTTVPLTEDERMFIKNRYDDCLCANCLMELRALYQEEIRLNDQIAQLVNSI